LLNSSPYIVGLVKSDYLMNQADRERISRPRELPGSDVEPLGQTTLASCRGRRNELSQELIAGITVAVWVEYDHLTQLGSWDEGVPVLSTLSSCSSAGKE
jgi:hypothetical protein